MKLPIPEKTLDQHVLVLGKTRSGKSSAMRLLVEHLLDKSDPVCIVDPKGDWWGLKASADGKHAGYPVVIFGGDHADVPLNSRSGAAVAELAATGNRPCIIDLGGWMPGARSEFLIDFLSTFFRTSRGRRWLIIDEVHNVAPQGKVLDPQAGKLLHWSNRIANEGSGKGITLISASQRPQKVHKDFVTASETLIAMRVIHPLDRGAIKDWIDGCGDPEKGKDVLATLASNVRGQGWVWSPEIDFGPKRVQFPMFSTYDSFKAQTAQQPAKLKGWADVNLDDVKKKLEAVVKEAEANDPVKLKARIRELQERSIANELVYMKPDPKAIDRAVYAATKELRKNFVRLLTKIRADLPRLDEAYKKRAELADFIDAEHDKLLHVAAEQPVAKAISKQFDWKPSRHLEENTKHSHEPVVPVYTGDSKLPEGERLVLRAAAQYDGVERKRITILTGYKKSTRDAYILRLRTKGFVVDNGKIVPTPEGLAALGDFELLPTGSELQRYWIENLPEGEKKIFEYMLYHYHDKAVDRDLLNEIGFAKSSRDAYLLRMRARGVVENVGRGEVKLSPELFE